MANAKKGSAFSFEAMRAAGARHRMWLAVGATVASLALVGWWMRPQKQIPDSKVGGMTAQIDATAGGKVQKESPQYQQSVEAANDKAFQEAMKTGRTNLPIVERAVDPLTPPPPTTEQAWKQPATPDTGPPPPVDLRAPSANLPAPAPPVQAAQAAAQAPPAAPPPKPTMDDAILAEMKSLAAAWAPRPALVVDVAPRTQPGAEGQADKAAQAGQPGTPAAARSRATPIIPAGTILYGSTLTAANSDAQGAPVVVTVDAGKFRKSRLIGSFTQQANSEALVVRFNLMSLPDGQSTPVSAYAVDGQTASTAVASDVDRRYLARYAPVLGAAFVAGMGQAAAQVGTTQQQSASGVTISQMAPTMKQAIFAGASTAAAAIAGDVMARAPKGPLVTLAADYPIAILFVDAVYAPGAAEAEQIAANNAQAAQSASALAIAQTNAHARAQAQQYVVPGYQGQSGLRSYPSVYGLSPYGPQVQTSPYGYGAMVQPAPVITTTVPMSGSLN